MTKKLLHNPFLIFSPFFCYYVYFILQHKAAKLFGDETRYIDFANHLTHGSYSPLKPHINLWNGPGYPIVLMPFVALHTPVLYVALLNALFLYLTLVLVYKAAKVMSNHKTALVAGMLLAVYPNALSILPILYTEALTYLLVAALMCCLVYGFVKGKAFYRLSAGLVFGFLILTKVIFGYVLFGLLAVMLVLLLFRNKRTLYMRTVYVLLIAFGVTLPWLAYTCWLTGKAFYWGNSGGMSLYWMSTPYEHEYGDWKYPNLNNTQYPYLYKSAETAALLKKNHAREVDFIMQHDELRRDELFKQAAIRNIEQHPLKFVHNYYDNVSRMLFNFPYSYAYQNNSVVENIITGSLLFWSSVLGLIITVLNWRYINYSVKLVLLITGLYLGLSGALSAYPRQFDVIVPVLLWWLAYLTGKLKQPSLRFRENEPLPEIDLDELSEMGIGRPKG